jgi:hypothetical protein
MGDDPAAWRCRRSQGSSDGHRCHTVVEIRLTSRTIGSLRLGPRRCRTDRNGRAGKQDRQARRARLLLLSSPKRRPVLQEGPRSCLEAPARCRAVSGLDHEAVHGQMVTHGTPPMRPATLLAHSGTTDPCGGEGSQRGTMAPQLDMGSRAVRPGKATQMPDTIPCPQRGTPARITKRFRLGSTDGSVEHLKDRLREQPLAHPAGRDGRPGAACRPGSRPASTAP